jgi:FMN phosphatase YigB (HAD superfamily)
MIKAVIFDMFGVVRPDNLPAAYRQMGGDPESDAQFIRDTIVASHLGLASSRVAFAQRLGITPDLWLTTLNADVQNDRELLAYIRKLKASYKTGLLSNIGRGELPRLLAPDELKLFDAAVASGDAGYAKPEAEAYELVAERLAVRLDECVFTDDRQDYCDGARAVGMQAILYQQFAQFKRQLAPLLD